MRRQVAPPCEHPEADQADDKDSVPDLIGLSDEEMDEEAAQNPRKHTDTDQAEKDEDKKTEDIPLITHGKLMLKKLMRDNDVGDKPAYINLIGLHDEEPDKGTARKLKEAAKIWDPTSSGSEEDDAGRIKLEASLTPQSADTDALGDLSLPELEIVLAFEGIPTDLPRMMQEQIHEMKEKLFPMILRHSLRQNGMRFYLRFRIDWMTEDVEPMQLFLVGTHWPRQSQAGTAYPHEHVETTLLSPNPRCSEQGRELSQRSCRDRESAFGPRSLCNLGVFYTTRTGPVWGTLLKAPRFTLSGSSLKGFSTERRLLWTARGASTRF